jgi:hypothetical protein
MNQQLVDQVVHVVLYEGYILYPYREVAENNRQRSAFGRVYPESYSREQLGVEPCEMQTECLVEGFPNAAVLDVSVRFLHPIRRDIGELSVPMRAMPAANYPDFFHVVPDLSVDGRHYVSWQEAIERTVGLPALTVQELLDQPRTVPFGFPAARTLEPIHDHTGLVAGVIVREQEAVSGVVELFAEPVDAAVTKISVRIVNQTPQPRGGFGDNDEIVLRTFASTHTVLHVRDGAFFSMIDPPESCAQAFTLCRNLGTWPVLVGDEAAQDRDTLLSSPIILYDYPKIADFSDSAEIEIPAPRRHDVREPAMEKIS